VKFIGGAGEPIRLEILRAAATAFAKGRTHFVTGEQLGPLVAFLEKQSQSRIASLRDVSIEALSFIRTGARSSP